MSVSKELHNMKVRKFIINTSSKGHKARVKCQITQIKICLVNLIV